MARFKRRLFSSLNLVTTVILLGALFIMVNYIASRRYIRRDFTRGQITALSDKTVQTLRGLTEPVSIIVFYQPSHRLYDLVKDLLKEYTAVSSNVRAEYVDPEQDIARAKQLAQQLQIDDLNLVVFQVGTRHKYLSDTDLADYEYASMQFGAAPRVKAFKGEDAFTSAIISVTHTDSPLIWFTTGHGEKSVDSSDAASLSDLKKYLEQQSLSIASMSLAGQTAIPADVKLVVMAGPNRRVTEQELLILQTYLEQGGRLLALIDPLEDGGLDGLLQRWGITLGMDIVVDPSRQLPFVSPANLLVTDYTQHPIVEKMKTLMTLFPLARSVRPAQPVPAGLTVTPLALTSSTGWGETNTANTTFAYDAASDLKGPLSIAVASQGLPAPPETGQAGTGAAESRLVVVGDSDFAINSQLSNVGNRDFFLGAVYWLIKKEVLIGIGPKPIETIKLNLTSSQLGRLFWFSFLAMPLLCVLAGAGVWWLRRK